MYFYILGQQFSYLQVGQLCIVRGQGKCAVTIFLFIFILYIIIESPVIRQLTYIFASFFNHAETTSHNFTFSHAPRPAVKLR